MSGEKEQRLVWIDLEMTGLHPEIDVILEIATIVTDNQLNILAKGPSLIIHQPEDKMSPMSDWVFNQHSKSGLLDAVRHSLISMHDAEQQTLTFLNQYCAPGIAPLCGNSVWQDRAFLRMHMPRIVDFLHYRMIDVTTVKELVKRWYPHNPHTMFKKQDHHRALDDIQESIHELAFYRQHFFLPNV